MSRKNGLWTDFPLNTFRKTALWARLLLETCRKNGLKANFPLETSCKNALWAGLPFQNVRRRSLSERPKLKINLKE